MTEPSDSVSLTALGAKLIALTPACAGASSVVAPLALVTKLRELLRLESPALSTPS